MASSTSTPCSRALPADYDGDLMIEIDEPSVESRYESHRIAFEWAQHGLAPLTG